MPIGRLVKRQNVECRENGFDSPAQAFGTPPRGAISQFGRYHDAGAHLPLAYFGDPIRNHALRTPRNVRNDVCVE